jgi:hypothetical protein
MTQQHQKDEEDDLCETRKRHRDTSEAYGASYDGKRPLWDAKTSACSAKKM